MAAKFQQRHYVEVAKLIRELRMENANRPDGMVIVDKIYAKFFEMFAADNPKFDPQIFYGAIYAKHHVPGS